MKRFHILLLSVVSLSLIVSSCGKSTVPGTQDGNWYRFVAPFQGPARSHAVSFVINQTQNAVTSASFGTTAYVGTGVDNYNTKYNDFFQATPSGDSTLSWTQIANFPGVGRTDAVAFSIGGIGYVGLGQDSALNPLSDFYSYDSTSGNWSQIASFGGAARYLSVGFGIQNYGYVGTGYDTRFYYGDFWKFDPSAGPLGAWTESTTFTGYKRSSAVSFVYNNIGYVVTGIGESNGVVNDFYRFSPNGAPADSYHQAQAANSWLHLNSITNVSTSTFDDGYTNIQRSGAVAFVMDGVTSGLGSPDSGRPKAFLTCGSAGSSTWEYDILSDLWTSRTAFENNSVNYAVAFTINNRGFVTTGASGSTGVSSSIEFFPDQVYNAQD
jgi:N-acetylneuraminic acid mutarotase